jgi:hypothetical protein
MTRFTVVGGILMGSHANEEKVCHTCRESVSYDWFWYDDEEIDSIQTQVDDGEKSFEDAGMRGPPGRRTQDLQRLRFNKLHAHYTAAAAGTFTLSLSVLDSILNFVLCRRCCR